MKKIILLKSSLSNYNVLRYWIDGLAIGFEKLGVETIVLDIKNSINQQMLSTLQLKDVDAVIAFNGLLIEQKEILERLIQIPYINVLIDHPIDHIGRIKNLRPKDILTVMDRNDVRMLKELNLYPENVFVLPHAALEMSLESMEKTIDILISASYSNPSAYLEYFDQHSPLLKKMCYEVIEDCLVDSNKYYIDVFLEKFSLQGIQLSLDIEENPVFIKIVREIGRYIYSIRREQVIVSLAEHNYTVDLYGNGWNESPFVKYKNVRIHEPVNFWSTQQLMRQSKIVINFQALLKDGTHERVFNGMAARAVVLTNETPYLKELFKENEELLFYNFDELNLMVEKVSQILSDSKKMKDISEAGWHIVKDSHTFLQRAQEIIDIYHKVYNK